MNYQVFDLTVAGSAGNPTLTTYIVDTPEGLYIKERPIIIVCPGGGYNHLSPREGEYLALQFTAMGYHAAVLRYSVTPAVYPTQLCELAKAVALIREHAKEWHVKEDGLYIQGSSAGGHLAASYGCFWKKEMLAEAAGVSMDMLRPNGLILSYPVITSGEYAHRGSFEMLLGERYDELLEEMSLEKQVSADTPRTFIWHTFEDQSVPVENTLLFAQALRKNNVSFECHIYPKGGHGVGLGNELTCSEGGKEMQPEVNTWVGMAGTFIKNV